MQGKADGWLALALYEPEIPPNTGNIIRLCANVGIPLHLIQPLGFHWDDKRLRRAGLDYAEFTQVARHENWHAFRQAQGGRCLLGLTTKSKQNYFNVDFVQFAAETGVTLVLGPETRGLPDTVLEHIGPNQCFRIPMAANSRSLNLSNAAAICVYEAWRQIGFQPNLLI